MKALALDFDGVLSDSAVESFVVALRTYAALRPDGPMAARAAALGSGAPEALRRDATFRAFLELMPLGNRAEDFGVVLSLLEAGAWAEDQAAYDAWRAAEPAGFLTAFHERFYRERTELRAADPEAWTALLAPYRPMLALLRRRAADVSLCIATAKDRPSVDVLLAHYGIADLFPAERVIDKEHGRTKRAHLAALHERLGVPFEDITFVDDKFNHLEDVAGLGIRCVLAAWGYNGAREQGLAREAGFVVCQLEDAEARLFGAASAGG